MLFFFAFDLHFTFACSVSAVYSLTFCVSCFLYFCVFFMSSVMHFTCDCRSLVVYITIANFTARIRRQFEIILSLKIPPHLKCVAALPCEIVLKIWHTFCTPYNLWNIGQFSTFLTVRIRRKFLITLSLKIAPHLKCVAALLCEMSVSYKQQLNTRRLL